MENYSWNELLSNIRKIIGDVEEDTSNAFCSFYEEIITEFINNEDGSRETFVTQKDIKREFSKLSKATNEILKLFSDNSHQIDIKKLTFHRSIQQHINYFESYDTNKLNNTINNYIKVLNDLSSILEKPYFDEYIYSKGPGRKKEPWKRALCQNIAFAVKHILNEEPTHSRNGKVYRIYIESLNYTKLSQADPIHLIREVISSKSYELDD